MVRRWAFLALGVLGLVATEPAWADRSTDHFTSITVFGDSLVDAGNFFIASGQTTPDPAQGFFQNRFTNGYDYPDLLSLSLFGTPTTPSFAGGNNFGIAAARLIDTGDGIPDLAAQLASFQATGRAIDPNGLYILNFGANDVFAAKGVFGPNQLGTYSDISSYLKAAAEEYVAGVQALNDLGVRNILMTDFPLAGDPLTAEANADLKTALAGLKLDSDTDLFFYSLSDLNTRVLIDPGAFGLPPERTDTYCIAAEAQATGCYGIFSFDGVHPTAAIQTAGFHDMDEMFSLSAVPEPASWVMMIVGFGATGIALRYRRRPAAAVRATKAG